MLYHKLFLFMVGFMIYNSGSLCAICDPGLWNDTDSHGQDLLKIVFTQNMEISRGLPSLTRDDSQRRRKY